MTHHMMGRNTESREHNMTDNNRQPGSLGFTRSVDAEAATEFFFHDVLGWPTQPSCEQSTDDPVTELLDMVEVIDDCPVCGGQIEVSDYHEYGQCYGCRLIEMEAQLNNSPEGK
jgi:hypothetical protein